VVVVVVLVLVLIWWWCALCRGSDGLHFEGESVCVVGYYIPRLDFWS
jgi:hypothetical protein